MLKDTATAVDRFSGCQACILFFDEMALSVMSCDRKEDFSTVPGTPST
jgi:hypothetical protein